MTIDAATRGVSSWFGRLGQPSALPTNVKFGQGHLWQMIEGTNHEQYYNGMIFKEEAPLTSLSKTAGLIIGGSFFFTGATLYHTCKMGYEVFVCSQDVLSRYKLERWEGKGVDLWSLIRSQEAEVYQKGCKSFSQAVKSYVCCIPFAMLPLPAVFHPATWIPFSFLHPVGWFADSNLGFYVGLGFFAYALYDPRYPRVLLNQVEKWVFSCPEGQKQMQSNENPLPREKPVGRLGLLQELLEFKVGVSRYLGWGLIDCKKED